LTPTRIYSQAILRLRRRLNEAGADLRGVSHITGGGLPGNVPRVLPEGLTARVDPVAWPMPSIMRFIGALGSLSDAELRSTFNGGLGMVAVVPSNAVETALASLAEDGLPAWPIGRVVAVDASGARYSEI
jgi:phosphoribosylformylglycinamidine cyclo-ligase